MLNAAIVGMGRWGRLLVDSVQGSAKIRFVAGTTRTLGTVTEYAASRGIAVKPDFRAVLDDPAVEAVVLATPHSMHADEIVEAAAAGKHLFVEKPFTLDRASAERAASACLQARRVLAVGFNRRFRPAMREVSRLAATGELGEILHMESQWSGPTPVGRKPDSWRNDRAESPAGGMTPKGIHLLDAMISLAGLAVSAYAQSDRRLDRHTDDVTAVLLRFSSGATGYLGTCLGTPDYWRLQVIGSRAWAEIRGEHQLVVCREGEAPVTRDYAPTNVEGEELEAFADAVAGRGAYPVTLEQAISGSAALEAIIRSAGEGAAVPIGPIAANIRPGRA
jgi:predicted dehydrogenase